MTDIVSIGIGGGSVFRVDKGQLRVGPESVGGSPGPACFGLGGKEATVTDALLVLGLLSPETYFGGSLDIDPALAAQAIENNVAQPLGIEIPVAAHAMFERWASDIAAALNRVAEIEKDTALIAFGGGGPMGALAVAEKAGIKKVLIPGLSAVFSAHGIAFSDIAHGASAILNNLSDSAFAEAVTNLRTAVQRNIQAEGFELADCVCTLSYRADGKDSTEIVDPSCMPHELAGSESVELEFAAVRPMARAELPEIKPLHVLKPVIKGSRTMWTPANESKELPLVLSKNQQPGTSGQGPAVIEEPFWTCLVGESWSYTFTLNQDVLFQFNGEQQ